MSTKTEKSPLFNTLRFNSSKSITPQQDQTRTASINDSDEDEEILSYETPKSSFASGITSITPALHKSFISDGIGVHFTNKSEESPTINFLHGKSEISVTLKDYFKTPEIKISEAKWNLNIPRTSFCQGVSSLSPELHKHFRQEELEEETSSSSEECIGNINGDHDILRLADQEDALKSFRVTQMRKLTEFPDELQVISEEVKNRDSKTSDPTSSEKGEDMLGSLGSLDLGLESKLDPSTPLSNQDVSEKPSLFGDAKQKTSMAVESAIENKTRTKSESQASKSAKFKALFQTKLNNTRNHSEGTDLPHIQGYLEKRSTRFLQLWQTRYVVVKDKKLQYYTNEQLEHLCGCLDFDLFCARIEMDATNPKKFSVYPVGGTTTFYFKAESKEEAKKWADMIRIHISVSDGAKCKLNSIAPKRNFWKNVRISEAKFLAESKTGDLLLFKTQNLSAIIQRSVTRSEYDHVGMLLKDKHGNIILFESTGNAGVGLCRWTSFKLNNWHTLYKKVIYRKLHVDRTKEFIEKAEKFVKNSVGKKYAISAKKLLQTKAEESSEDSTFFCSELVAACYKKLGLLPGNVASSSYFPGAFSSEKKLDLLGEAKLGEEYLIDFNL